MRAILLTVLLAGCATAPAERASISLAGPAIVRDVAAPGADVQSAAYVRLHNAGEADRLVAVSCTCAESVELHATANRAMHTLPHIDAPAGGDLEIAPGGPTHLMLMGVREPIAPGATIRMRLEFERAAPLEVEFVAVENSREGWAARDVSASRTQARP